MITATLRNAPFSAYKGRLVVDMIRGLSVEEAVNKLKFTQKDSAIVVKKLLESAIANAEHNASLDIDDLKVSAVFVDEGVTLKRFKARAKGRANHIRKRTCNITIKVD